MSQFKKSYLEGSINSANIQNFVHGLSWDPTHLLYSPGTCIFGYYFKNILNNFNSEGI